MEVGGAARGFLLIMRRNDINSPYLPAPRNISIGVGAGEKPGTTYKGSSTGGCSPQRPRSGPGAYAAMDLSALGRYFVQN